MSCPYRTNARNNDGSACCSLTDGEVSQDRQQEYCASHKAYEACPAVKNAEILTESVCKEIADSFSEAAFAAAEGLAAIYEFSKVAVRFDYLPLIDAFRVLDESARIPSADGLFEGMVKTDPEKELASRLDQSLSDALSQLKVSFRIGYCDGAHPCISTSEIWEIVDRVNQYAEAVCSSMENYHVSVKPEKYGEAAQSLAAETGKALRVRLVNASRAMEQAAQMLEQGIQRTMAACGSVGTILRNSGVRWEVD